MILHSVQPQIMFKTTSYLFPAFFSEKKTQILGKNGWKLAHLKAESSGIRRSNDAQHRAGATVATSAGQKTDLEF